MKNGFALARDLQHFLYEGRALAKLISVKIDLKIFYDISHFLPHQNRRSSKSKSLKSTRKENKGKKINYKKNKKAEDERNDENPPLLRATLSK